MKEDGIMREKRFEIEGKKALSWYFVLQWTGIFFAGEHLVCHTV